LQPATEAVLVLQGQLGEARPQRVTGAGAGHSLRLVVLRYVRVVVVARQGGAALERRGAGVPGTGVASPKAARGVQGALPRG
jgi:hypothetical protein